MHKQLLAAHLQEADPAMYDIIEAVSDCALPRQSPSWTVTDQARGYRRRRDKGTLST
jgi:hypothetical protein